MTTAHLPTPPAAGSAPTEPLELTGISAASLPSPRGRAGERGSVSRGNVHPPGQASQPTLAVEPVADDFVRWFRHATPYVHAHRGRTFVIAFGGEAVADKDFRNLIHDLALLHGLGIRLILVHGARPQIQASLARRGAGFRYVNGLRVTDGEALASVKEAAGSLRVEIEALFSQGLANSPMAGVRIPIASGNFVTAKPLGIIDGVDYQHTGLVRRIDHEALWRRLDDGAIALISPIGYSPTGEVFNLSAADLARATAIALQADKLIFLLEGPGLVDAGGQPVSNILSQEIAGLLEPGASASSLTADSAAGPGSPPVPRPDKLSGELAQALRAGADACRQGVKRVHLVSCRLDGALLRELFTRDGVGTLITATPFEELRPAGIEDVGGILELLRPLEEAGVLVRRSRERLETEIERFYLMERDGMAIACAALYAYPAEGMAELAGFAVHPDYRGRGRGALLLDRMTAMARQQGLSQLFVLTTQTAHWFRERGFEPARLTDLPMAKQALYNFQRNSKVFIKLVG